jgi:ABC-type glycerol-3-phosphate transport system substrate-binding protein
MLTGVFALAQDDDVTEITWATFWVGTNPLTPWGEILIEEYNTMYAGECQVVTEEVPGDAAYRDKMRADAVADALPDLITGNITLMRDMTNSGRVVNLTPYLEADEEWLNRFYDDAFDAYYAPDGNLYAIPYSRDYVGIYWNTALFEEAGIQEFPDTWEGFMEASAALSEAGITPFAMEGNWVTRLMWANMVGTMPGGAEWLNDTEGERQFVGVEPVIMATEMLRDYHNMGYVNEDAFTGDYNTAATLYLQAEAAMIANGPWMINQISGETAETADGLYDNTQYAISPGTAEDDQGIILINGEAGFAVGSDTEAETECAVNFLKLLTSEEQMITQLQIVGRDGATTYDLTEDDMASVDRMAVSIIDQGVDTANQYPHTGIAFTNAQVNEFVNQWPAYVAGDMTTEEFLQTLEDAM